MELVSILADFHFADDFAFMAAAWRDRWAYVARPRVLNRYCRIFMPGAGQWL